MKSKSVLQNAMGSLAVVFLLSPVASAKQFNLGPDAFALSDGFLESIDQGQLLYLEVQLFDGGTTNSPITSNQMANQMDFRRIPESLLAHCCLMYEEGDSLNFLERTLERNGFTLDEYYAQYHLIDCHESRMTPIYRFVMGLTPNLIAPELRRELDYFRAMDEARRFEILNRVDVWHRRDGSERMRLTLLDQVAMQAGTHRAQNSPIADSYEAFMQTLISLGAKRHSEMTAAELQRAPVRSRK